MIRGWDDEIASSLHGVPFSDEELATIKAQFDEKVRQALETPGVSVTISNHAEAP